MSADAPISKDALSTQLVDMAVEKLEELRRENASLKQQLLDTRVALMAAQQLAIRQANELRKQRA
jgi:hypothetical protein